MDKLPVIADEWAKNLPKLVLTKIDPDQLNQRRQRVQETWKNSGKIAQGFIERVFKSASESQEWNKMHVYKYMLLGQPPEQRTKILQQLRNRTLSSFLRVFQSIFELDHFQGEYDSQNGQGAFRQLIEKKINSLPWQTAMNTEHPLQLPEHIRKDAIRAQLRLLQQSFAELRLEKVSLPALFIARPSFWDNVRATKKSVYELYLSAREKELGIAHDHDDSEFPLHLGDDVLHEVNIAASIFRMCGDGPFYDIFPADAVLQKGWQTRIHRPTVKVFELLEDSK